MRVSVCITVFNEEKSISSLIESLLNQTKKPDDIVIVDGGSTDGTVKLIKSFKDPKIRLIVKKSTRAEGRNLSIKNAKNEIIAITDADCIAKDDWLEKITRPFGNKKIDIVAGFYEMKAKKPIQKAAAYFLGVTPERFKENKFLPSTRSIAFRKRIWKKLGGFPESENNSAEDTDFNYKAVKAGAKYTRVKDARVEWKIPESISEFRKKIYDYAKWDVEYGIFWHPVQRFGSHNIKVLLVWARYLVGIILLILSIKHHILLYFLTIGIIFYSIYSFYKIYRSTNSLQTGFWGAILQFVTDSGVIQGSWAGLFNKKFR